MGTYDSENGESGPPKRNRGIFSFKAFPGSVKSSREFGRTQRRGTSVGLDADETRSFLTSDDSLEHLRGGERGEQRNSDLVLNSAHQDDLAVERVETVKDPGIVASTSSPGKVSIAISRSMSDHRVEKFKKILDEPIVDLVALRELSWSGIPPTLRPLCWRLLLGYVPPSRDLREQVLSRKRIEYKNLVPDYYDGAAATSLLLQQGKFSSHTTEEEHALRQVVVDVPRTAPDVPFFHQERVHKILERILFIWGLRHPASGYVQGINDLATPFLAVFTSERMTPNTTMNEWDLSTLTEDELLEIEADSYWCLCKLLDGIQDHYTYAQPGIQKTLFHVGELITRIESRVAEHFESEGVEYMQFAFRWVNCLLLREVPFMLGVRLWDTYLAEGPALKEFLVYVISSFLLNWAPELGKKDFQDLIMYLQHLPTDTWSEAEIEMVLSRAFMWRASFKGASSHFS